MCDTCGCNITPGNAHHAHTHRADGVHTAVDVLTDLLHENDHAAAHNRDHFDRHGVLAINLMSSPGAGKTTLLEATLEALSGRYRMAVIEGDLETENDAERIRAHGVPAIQITTGSACHLDAHMVHDALHQLDLDGLDLVFIENVGNLVCPANFDLGQHANVAMVSVTEGDDKAAKYPVMFRAADLVLVSKTDMLDFIDDFEPGNVQRSLHDLAIESPLLRVSSRRRPDLTAWLDWLHARLERAATPQPTSSPESTHATAAPARAPAEG